MNRPVAEIGLGHHYSLSEQEVEAFRLLPDSTSVEGFLGALEFDFVVNSPGRIAGSANTWEFIHQAFTKDPRHPLGDFILGGEGLHAGSGYLVRLTTPARVREVDALLSQIGQESFHRLFKLIPAASYDPPLDEQDLEFTWNCFERIRAVWALAAAQARYILFTAGIVIPEPKPQKHPILTVNIPQFLLPDEVPVAFDNESPKWTLPNGETISGWVSGDSTPRKFIYLWFEDDDVPGLKRGSVKYRVFPFDQPGGDWRPFLPAAEVYRDDEDGGAQLGAKFKLPLGRYAFELRIDYEGRFVELRGGNFHVFRGEKEILEHHEEQMRLYRSRMDIPEPKRST